GRLPPAGRAGPRSLRTGLPRRPVVPGGPPGGAETDAGGRRRAPVAFALAAHAHRAAPLRPRVPRPRPARPVPAVLRRRPAGAVAASAGDGAAGGPQRPRPADRPGTDAGGGAGGAGRRAGAPLPDASVLRAGGLLAGSVPGRRPALLPRARAGSSRPEAG